MKFGYFKKETRRFYLKTCLMKVSRGPFVIIKAWPFLHKNKNIAILLNNKAISPNNKAFIPYKKAI